VTCGGAGQPCCGTGPLAMRMCAAGTTCQFTGQGIRCVAAMPPRDAAAGN
jgi:hypothetical protein